MVVLLGVRSSKTIVAVVLRRKYCLSLLMKSLLVALTKYKINQSNSLRFIVIILVYAEISV